MDDSDIGKSSLRSRERTSRSHSSHRSRSAPRERRRSQDGPLKSAIDQSTLRLRPLPYRSKVGRFVSLGGWDDEATSSWPSFRSESIERRQDEPNVAVDIGDGPRPDIGEATLDAVKQSDVSVEVRCHCIGYEIDRAEVQDVVLRRLPSSSLQAFPGNVVCSNLFSTRSSVLESQTMNTAAGDILMFCSAGAAVFWGLADDDERYVLREVAEPCVPDESRLGADRRENDCLTVTYKYSPRANIYNDRIDIHVRHIDDLEVKLAVSAALAQSTQLRVCEEDFRRLVKRIANVPTQLAEHGAVTLQEREILRIIGEIYQQKSTVNLVGAAMVMPESVEASPKAIRTLYHKCHEYLDIEERLALLNDRFAVTSELMQLCRTLGHQARLAQLDSYIIWLLVACVLLAVFQLAGFSGWGPPWRALGEQELLQQLIQ